ncbi:MULTISPECIES: DVU3141 family protein [unclassified Halomonas]|uniref:DVU3141 family protein n=1 Tax=unclassified Halomonas TaxID=2609666 RepID=UPI00299DA9FE|nr:MULTISPECIES: DVU3141 family protein [unclassified Halomonas]
MSTPQRLPVMRARMLLAMLSAAILTGCASYPASNTQQEAQYVLNNDPATLIKNANLNEFLAQAPAGGIINVANSPWGDGVEIVADAAYLAASGRECRKLKVVAAGSSNARTALVCKTPDGWVDQRVVIETTEGRY